MLKNRGYTLVELMVVIAIIAVLIGMLLVDINPQRVITDTRDARSRTEMNQIKTALQLYFNDNNAYPGSLGAMVPTYAKALPGVTTESSFNYVTYAGNSDYDAGVQLNNSAGDDASTVAKCDGDGTSSATGNHMIC